ncbi:AT-hook motif nuclear-localized protein 5-like isoform X2 [Juglans microcarpa x Juglans regia]|uniref:AT-hook motif nuclear-localized protein 5-like isoform X2 n=1 Tax=Juglans microcarpa x Juglans regia TaxID=2249226 RepID=UPI001B7F0E99|nr:AT-hook motif nuclear-localized protein 5-like isoform X2 [Juglans microcarpa x Juglans regia]
MDGREAMALSSGSASYYIHRGGVGGVSETQSGVLQAPPGFRAVLNQGIPAQPNIRGSSVGQAFSVERPHANFTHGISIGVSPGVHSGEWMNSSAGVAFAPHVITIGVGEDIVAKILSFSQQRPRAVCILSGSGTVSSVTLRQPASTDVSVRYEGHFQILCLSGSFLVAEDGGPRNRTGGISVSISSHDGLVIGGSVAMLIAATPVQVVVCSFVYGDSKTKTKQVADPNQGSEAQRRDKLATPTSAMPTQNYAPPVTGMWPSSRPVEMRNQHTGIDLTRG